MRISEIAKKWDHGERWIRERCREHMIPQAEKKRFWDIPEEATEPPCTRHYASEVMRRLDTINNGTNIKFFPSTDPEKLRTIMSYLEEWAFISADNSDGTAYPKVTDLGKRLMNEDAISNKKYDKRTTTKGIEVGSSGISASYEVKEETSN